jgi:putative phage-type endonuclease
MRLLDVEQGTPEWHAARLGKVTASRIADVMAKTKTGYGAGRANYMAELICERLTGASAERFTNAAMAWGTDMEPQARETYAFVNAVDVAQIGFVLHPTIDDAGASPDGLVGDDGLVEIKCPNTATHIETLLSGKVPQKYADQMQWQMACTGRQWCDFVSYDPRLPDHLSLWVRRVARDDDRIAEMTAEVGAFLSEMGGKLAQLEKVAA